MLDNRTTKKRNRKQATTIDELCGVCAGCGEKNPEYVLDERRLCFDCYRAERYYWAKDL